MAWISDPQLAAQLKGAIDRIDHEIQWAEQPTLLVETARTMPSSRLILDVRPDQITQETIEILTALLAQPAGQIGLLTLGTSDWPASVAAHCEALSVGHIECQAGWERDELQLAELDRFLEGSRTSPRRSVYRFDAPERELVTSSTELATLYDRVMRVATLDATALFVGENGTGKKSLARMIHDNSDRRDAPFVTFSCGATPVEAIDSKLFGKAASVDSDVEKIEIGLLAAAGTGTLFLDDVDLLPLEQQAKLLRVIQRGEYEPVGSFETRTSSARLLAASSVPLQPLCRTGEFRPDLYQWLTVFRFELPPLRQRRDDIPILATRMLQEFCDRQGFCVDRISRDLFTAFSEYHWPGNLLELRTVVERAVLAAADGHMTIHQLPAAVRNAGTRPAAFLRSCKTPA